MYAKLNITRKSVPRKTLKQRGASRSSLQILYNSKNVINAQKLMKAATTKAPRIEFPAQPGKLNTLIMWDIDAPAKPSWVHWIAINMETAADIPTHTLLPYEGPNPPYGAHRYRFAIFEQLTGGLIIPPPPRPHFDIDTFVNNNHLKMLYTRYIVVQ